MGSLERAHTCTVTHAGACYMRRGRASLPSELRCVTRFVPRPGPACRTTRQQQLEGLMAPAEGSEPLHFKSLYAVSSSLQAKTCMERAVKQVSKPSKLTLGRSSRPKKGGSKVDLGERWPYVSSSDAHRLKHRKKQMTQTLNPPPCLACPPLYPVLCTYDVTSTFRSVCVLLCVIFYGDSTGATRTTTSCA